MLSFHWIFLLGYLLSSFIFAFEFTHNSPTECDNLKLSWIGGTAPFFAHLIPVFGTPRNHTIPLDAFRSGHGSYNLTLPFPDKQKFVLSMSDSTGFATGGTTEVLVTGPSQGGTCNSTDPGTDFLYQLNSALQQCRSFGFTNYTGAAQPISIYCIVPGGTSLVLQPPEGPASFDWTANVAQETFMMFMLVDSQGRQGGSSDVRLVGNSNDNSCLDNNAPSSTEARLSPTATDPGPVITSSVDTDVGIPEMRPGGPSIAVIAGTVIGSMLFLAVLVTMGLFFLKRFHDKKMRSSRMYPPVDLAHDPSEQNRNHPYQQTTLSAGLNLSSPFLPGQTQNPFDQSTTSLHLGVAYSSTPSDYHPSQSHPPSSGQVSSSYSNYPHVQATYPPSEATSSTPSKAQLTGQSNHKPTRFIMHTDVEDIYPPPNEDGIVELPPQYTERRGTEFPPQGSQRLPYR